MNVFDQTDLVNEVKKIVVDNHITHTVFSARPKAKDQGESFVVVNLASGIDDLAAYGDTDISVDLFVKDVANIPNTAKLSWMYQRLMAVMPAEIGRYMISRTPMVLPDVSDDYGYTARIVNFQVIIKHA